MYTDLFRALANPANPPRHPLLAALLYNFCPASAKWWLAGALPVIPYDPVWHALEDCSAGRVLKDAVRDYGLESMWDDARAYLGSIKDYRASYRNVHAPELSPLFSPARLSQGERFGLQEAFANFGGDWRNFYRYLHARFFLIPDWGRRSGLDESQVSIRVRKMPVRFALGFVRKSIQWETWAIQARTGGVKRLLLGLLFGRGQEQDAMRFFLTQRAGPDEGSWNVTPEVIGLERSGLVVPYRPALSDAQMEALVEKHIQLAEHGPHPALHALRQPSMCRACGFRAQCFTPEEQLSPLVIRTFERNIP